MKLLKINVLFFKLKKNDKDLKYLTVTTTPIIKQIIPRIMNKIPRPRAKSGPTDDTFRQCGHRARALFSVLNCRKKNRKLE